MFYINIWPKPAKEGKHEVNKELQDDLKTSGTINTQRKWNTMLEKVNSVLLSTS